MEKQTKVLAQPVRPSCRDSCIGVATGRPLRSMRRLATAADALAQLARPANSSAPKTVAMGEATDDKAIATARVACCTRMIELCVRRYVRLRPPRDRRRGWPGRAAPIADASGFRPRELRMPSGAEPGRGTNQPDHFLRGRIQRGHSPNCKTTEDSRADQGGQQEYDYPSEVSQPVHSLVLRLDSCIVADRFSSSMARRSALLDLVATIDP